MGHENRDAISQPELEIKVTNARELIAALKADLPAGSHRIVLPASRALMSQSLLVACQRPVLSQNGCSAVTEHWSRFDSTLQAAGGSATQLG